MDAASTEVASKHTRRRRDGCSMAILCLGKCAGRDPLTARPSARSIAGDEGVHLPGAALLLDCCPEVDGAANILRLEPALALAGKLDLDPVRPAIEGRRR